MKALSFLITLFFASLTLAAHPLPQSPSSDIIQKISEHNAEQAKKDRQSGALEVFRSTDVRPFAEYEKNGYIFMNDDNYFGYAANIKATVAQNLPKGVKLVVYSESESQSYLKDIRAQYEQFIDPAQLIVLKVPRSGSNDFWSRDNLPVPVWTNGALTLVDARYYYNFEPDQFIAHLFDALYTQHNYFYEGGNFMANSRGECIVVNRRRSYPGGTSDTGAIPDEIFTSKYGCKKLTRLKHLKGIGHADEVVKFMSDDIIVTDTQEYADILKKQGYQVHMLPEPDLAYETYVNSLLVNDVLFVPSFGEAGDSKAVQVYESLNLGYKVVTADTRRLATRGQGGIHCTTMNYPDVPLAEIVRAMNATIIQ